MCLLSTSKTELSLSLSLFRNEDAINQMAVPPCSTPPPPPVLSSVSPEPVCPAPLCISPPTDGPRPPDSVTCNSSSDTASESREDAQQNRKSNSAPKRVREDDTSQQSLTAAEPPESPEVELQATQKLPEQQSCKSSSSSCKQMAPSPPLISADLQTTNKDPSCCAVVPGQEMLLEICKGRSGLGLSIVGGRDTQLDAIVIHEVYGEGAAARDARLWAGDQILE
ncbi:hypothetical protein JOQ06_006231, partial [Pogonophryne albipinna]